MPVNLPSLTELQNAQFVDPMFFGQVQNQIGLGNQFAQQGLERGAADLQQQVLANLFAEQNNPQRLEQQRMQNEGLGYDNITKGVQSRTAAELEGEDKAAKRAKMLAAASEDDLKRLTAQAEAEMLNPDPVVQARARKKLEGSWQELQRRNKASDELAKTKAAGDVRLQAVGAQQAGANARNDADNAAAMERARLASVAKQKNGSDMWSNLTSGKVPPERAAVAFSTAAMQEENPELRQKYLQAAEVADKMAQRLKANQGGQIDMSEYVKTNPFQSDVSNMPSMPGAGARPAAPAAQQRVTGPTNAGERSMQAAVADTLQVPNLAEEIRRQQQIVDSGVLSKEDQAVAKAYIQTLKSRQGSEKPTLNKLPPGAKQIGTSKGKPVYQTPDGQRFLGE